MTRKKDNGIIDLLNKDIFSTPINGRILSLFLKQLSLLISSGIGLDTSLKIIEKQNIDKKLSIALHMVNGELDKGRSIPDAFYIHKSYFNPIILAFIRSGDESGKLSEVLDELADYLDEDSKNKAAIKQAMAYPIILLFMTIFIVILIMTFVLPTFKEVFETNNQLLPISTRMLMGMSNFILSYGLWLIIGFAILILIIVILRRDDKYRLRIDRFTYLHFPFRKFRILSLEYQMASIMHIMMKGGVDLIRILQIVKDSFTNTYIKSLIDQVIINIKQGYSLSYSLEARKIFTSLFISMIKIGENSGQLVKAMDKTNKYYANEYIFRLKKISQYAEPVMLLIMSLIVAFVVFAIALPIFDSVNSVSF